MNPKKLLWGLIPLLMIPVVYARDLLDMILYPFRGVSLGSVYTQYFAFIDAVIYVILFLSLAQMVFKKAYEGREGKLVGIAVGLALAIAMAVFELRTGFNLGKLAPLAALVFFIVLIMLLFNVLKGLFGEVRPALCFTILISFGLLVTTFSMLYTWIDQTVPLLYGLIHIALVAAFICALMSVIDLFKGNGSDSNSGGKRYYEDKPQGGGEKPGGGDDRPSGTNTVTLINPAPESHHPQGKPIQVMFQVNGPDLDPPKKFDYDILLESGKVFYADSKVSAYEIHPKKQLPDNLPVGPHTIFINTYKPGESKNIGKTGPQKFFIDKDVAACKVEIIAPVPGGQTARIDYGHQIIFGFKTTNIKVSYKYTWKILDKDKNEIGGENETKHYHEELTIPNINRLPFVKYSSLPEGEYILNLDVTDQNDDKYQNAINIQIRGSPTNASVKIITPHNGAQIEEGQPIPLEFDTTNINTPFTFRYHIQNKIIRDIVVPWNNSPNKSMAIPDINAAKFTPGRYAIIVEVKDPITGKIYDNSVIVEIVIKPGTNTVKILNPVGNNPINPGTTVPVEIEVSGPHHITKKPYTYIIIVMSDKGRKIWGDRGTDTREKITHGVPIPALQAGNYIIKVFTGDPNTGRQISLPAQEKFIVQGSGSGTPPVGPTTGKVKTPSRTINVPIQIINPRSGDTIDKNKGFMLEYVTNHPMTHNCQISFPGNGNIIKEKRSIYNNNKPIQIRISKSDMKNVLAGKNKKLKIEVLEYNNTKIPKSIDAIDVNII